MNYFNTLFHRPNVRDLFSFALTFIAVFVSAALTLTACSGGGNRGA